MNEKPKDYLVRCFKSQIFESHTNFFILKFAHSMDFNNYKTNLSHIKMESFNSSLFRDWYKMVGGSSVSIDFKNRELVIFNSMGESIASLDFAKNIDSKFNLADLFKEKFESGDFQYHVFPNDFFLCDTLWRVKISAIM